MKICAGVFMWGKRLAAIVMTGLCCMMFVIYSEKRADRRADAAADGVCMDNGQSFYEKTVAITFDDGPRSSSTVKLLDGLKERGIRATFFVVGENIPGNEEIIARMHDEGHIIGNHTYTHVELAKLSHSAAVNEINKTNSLITRITGEPVKFIRPPCGSWNEKLLYEFDMTPVFWSVDPKDWCTQSVSTVVSRVMTDVSDGDIILFHDIYDSSVTAALEVIDRLSAQGFKFVTIDDILIE